MAVLWSYFAVEDYAELRENKSCGLYDHLACFRLDVCDGGGHLGLGGCCQRTTHSVVAPSDSRTRPAWPLTLTAFLQLGSANYSCRFVGWNVFFSGYGPHVESGLLQHSYAKNRPVRTMLRLTLSRSMPFQGNSDSGHYRYWRVRCCHPRKPVVQDNQFSTSFTYEAMKIRTLWIGP